jgi:hypothetical protein
MCEHANKLLQWPANRPPEIVCQECGTKWVATNVISQPRQSKEFTNSEKTKVE